jgi:hypothetical protein
MDPQLYRGNAFCMSNFVDAHIDAGGSLTRVCGNQNQKTEVRFEHVPISCTIWRLKDVPPL